MYINTYMHEYICVIYILYACVHAKSLQLCLTLCNPMDCSPPGSSLHGILQARILEWTAMPSSSDLPDPGIEPVFHAASASQVDSLLLSHLGSPYIFYMHIIMNYISNIIFIMSVYCL